MASRLLSAVSATATCVLLLTLSTGNLVAQKSPSFGAVKEIQSVFSVGLGGVGPTTAAQGDLNGDGIPDLVMPATDPVTFSTQNGAVMLGNADGTFQTPVTFFVAVAVQSTVIADFNRDGKNDVAFSVRDGVAILLGDGKGNLGAPQIFAASGSPTGMVAGDFNGDHKVDLAVVNAATNDVSVLLGKGDGTFQPAQEFPVGQGPIGIAAGDFNGDGHLDLAVANSNQFLGKTGPNGNTVAILLGTGTGGFAPASFIPVAKTPIGVTVSDLNRDGKLDVVVTNSGTDQVSVLLGKGNGGLQNPVTFSVTSGFEPISTFAPTYVSVDDLNGDGNPDLIVANADASTAALLLGNGRGNFGKATNILVGATPQTVLTGDFNHDGRRDFLTANSLGGTVSVVFGKGNGKFQVAPGFATADRADQIAVGDFNGDGILDIATANAGINFTGTTVSILLGKKGGGFARQQVITVKKDPSSILAADLNHDGVLDLVVASSGDPASLFDRGSLSVMIGNGDGTFQAAVNVGNLRNPRYAAVGDFNNDGNLDLVACSADERGASLLVGDGKGGFGSPSTIPLNSGCLQAETADFNRDGNMDVVFRLERNPGLPITFVSMGNGNGTFGPAKSVSIADVFGLTVGDVNNDGVEDVVLVEAGAVVTLLGDGTGKFTFKGFGLGPIPTLFHTGLLPVLGDFNGDGFLDVAVADEASHTLSILLGNGDGRMDVVLSGNDSRTGAGVATVLLNNTPAKGSAVSFASNQ